MKTSKIISLSAVTTAFSVIFLAFGAYVDVMDLSCLFMASVMMMLPIAKKSVKCAFLTYGATAILSLLVTMGSGKFSMPILYALFFGLHPILNFLEKEKKLNKVLMFIVKDVLFVGSLALMYFVFTLFVDLPDFIVDYAIYVILIGGAIVFIAYDFIMKRFQYLTDNLIFRLKI